MTQAFSPGQNIRLKPIDSSPTKTQTIISIADEPCPGSFDGETRQMLTLDNGKTVVGAHCELVTT